jgi:hypothetical protein
MEGKKKSDNPLGGKRRNEVSEGGSCQHTVGAFFYRPIHASFFGLVHHNAARGTAIRPLGTFTSSRRGYYWKLFLLWCHANSPKNTPAAPIPVPMHIEVTRTFRPQQHQNSVDHSTQYHHEPCHLSFPIRSALSQFAARLSLVYGRNVSPQASFGLAPAHSSKG